MKKIFILIFLMIIIFSLISTSSAYLIEYEGDIVYDTHFDITWLKDAKYALTSGYDSDGLMSWPDAMSWASNLS